MPARYSYLALEDDHRLVTDWFSALPDEVTVSDRADRRLLYFRAMATQPLPADDRIDQEKMPFVFIQRPQKKRGTLWSDSEVYFTPSPFRLFPALQKISRSFVAWLQQFDLVFTQKSAGSCEWSYYLEAGIQNYAEELYALPSAMAVLRAGQYFVHHRATDGQLDVLAKSLRLRGYHVEAAEPAATDNSGELRSPTCLS